MTERNIYLDYAATTPVDPDVAAAMRECLEPDGNFANAFVFSRVLVSAHAGVLRNPVR